MAKKIFRPGDELTIGDAQESFRIASEEYINILSQNIPSRAYKITLRDSCVPHYAKTSVQGTF